MNNRAGETTVVFTKQDIELFSAASGDRNPLHLSAAYARGTAYGEPVVFGCLGAVACIGHLRLPGGFRMTALSAEFLRPMTVGVRYRLEASDNAGTWKVRLLDGSLPMVVLTAKAEVTQLDVDASGDGPIFPTREPTCREEASIRPGVETSGTYACEPAALRNLAKRWQVNDLFVASVLCWSSYLVGMELPGASALFSKLVLDFNINTGCTAVMRYHARVVSFDTRFSQTRLAVSLSSNGSNVATGQCWSFVRPALSEMEEDDISGVQTDSLAGKCAAMIGASRGLGAALKAAIERRGGVVYSLSRSTRDVDAQFTEVGDAADVEALQRLRNRIMQDQGRLDFLVCNAFPPILPLRLEPNGAERIATYINQAMGMTVTPLCMFLEVLNNSGGCLVLISSTAVEQPVKEWPHYTAAKQAAEMLARVAQLQYPTIRTLIVRPQKLLTALTNTPMGRAGATSPRVFADRIAARLEAPLEPGNPEILI